jgi:hypothetical protein
LLPRLTGLLPRLLSLLTVLAVLPSLDVKVLTVANLLLLQVPDALANLIHVLRLQAILVPSLKAVLVARLVWLLGGQGQHRAGREQKRAGQYVYALAYGSNDFLMFPHRVLL